MEKQKYIKKCKREVRFWGLCLLVSLGVVGYEVYTMLYTDKTPMFDWNSVIILTVLAVWVCFFDWTVAKRKLRKEQQFHDCNYK